MHLSSDTQLLNKAVTDKIPYLQDEQVLFCKTSNMWFKSQSGTFQLKKKECSQCHTPMLPMLEESQGKFLYSYKFLEAHYKTVAALSWETEEVRNFFWNIHKYIWNIKSTFGFLDCIHRTTQPFSFNLNEALVIILWQFWPWLASKKIWRLLPDFWWQSVSHQPIMSSNMNMNTANYRTWFHTMALFCQTSQENSADSGVKIYSLHASRLYEMDLTCYGKERKLLWARKWHQKKRRRK